MIILVLEKMLHIKTLLHLSVPIAVALIWVILFFFLPFLLFHL